MMITAKGIEKMERAWEARRAHEGPYLTTAQVAKLMTASQGEKWSSQRVRATLVQIPGLFVKPGGRWLTTRSLIRNHAGTITAQAILGVESPGN